MTVMAWLWIGLSILGAIVLAAVVWLAGPLVSIGDVQPFDSALVRLDHHRWRSFSRSAAPSSGASSLDAAPPRRSPRR